MAAEGTSMDAAAGSTAGAGEATGTPAFGSYTLETLPLTNLALKALPIDPEKRNTVRGSVAGACFSLVEPDSLKNPRLVSASADALALLGIGPGEQDREDFALFMSGNKAIPGARPAAHCYCGHQFGYFSGQLGDGATMYLGDMQNGDGDRVELQFKGAGLTPYSRQGDGRKVLRSSLREYLCSESNHFLGIPTTRAGALVTSDSMISRDMFYTGDNQLERCSVVLRIAPTFLRFGSFEIFKPADEITGRAGPSVGRRDILDRMLDYVITNFFPDVASVHDDAHTAERNLAFFQSVVQRTARTVAKWQSVGFCHGVLNTDNMSILGLTIDYGPYGYLDRYDPKFICNSSDHDGRYSYANQPDVCRWNCERLFDMLQVALPKSTTIEPLLKEYFDTVYYQEYDTLMRRKLGLSGSKSEGDEELIEDLLDIMARSGADFTLTFRKLAIVDVVDSDTKEEDEAGDGSTSDVALTNLLVSLPTPKQMVAGKSPPVDQRTLAMLVSRLKSGMFPPEHRSAIEHAIEEATSYFTVLARSPTVKAAEDQVGWAKWLARYRARLQTEYESSSKPIEEAKKDRQAIMALTNPVFVLRNHVAQAAIEAAEKGDFDVVDEVLRCCCDPYNEAAVPEEYRTPPTGAKVCLKVSCSS